MKKKNSRIKGSTLIETLYVIIEGRLPTVWGDVSEADRGDRLRQRNPFSKGFPSISRVKTSVKVPPLKSGAFYFISLFSFPPIM